MPQEMLSKFNGMLYMHYIRLTRPFRKSYLHSGTPDSVGWLAARLTRSIMDGRRPLGAGELPADKDGRRAGTTGGLGRPGPLPASRAATAKDTGDDKLNAVCKKHVTPAQGASEGVFLGGKDQCLQYWPQPVPCISSCSSLVCGSSSSPFAVCRVTNSSPIYGSNLHELTAVDQHRETCSSSAGYTRLSWHATQSLYLSSP